MTELPNDDRVGVMWLHAQVSGDEDAARRILEPTGMRVEMLKAAVFVAIEVMRRSPSQRQHAADIRRVLMHFALVDDALEDGQE